jgi:hypothetical protein
VGKSEACPPFEIAIASFVIASEAKQSIEPRNGSMDCFVATLLAMTVLERAVTAETIIQSFASFVIPGRCAAWNYDVQLHIGESRDSGSGPSDQPEMTRRDCFAWFAMTSLCGNAGSALEQSR